MTPEQMTGISAIVVAATGLVTSLGVVFVAIVQKRQGSVVKEVKKDLEQVKPIVQNTAAQLGVVHKIINSGYLEDLRVGMVAAKTLAAIQPTMENVTLAEVATKKYNEHLLSQVALEASPVPAIRPVPVGQSGSLEHAIGELIVAAEETVESADKTVDVANKVPLK